MAVVVHVLFFKELLFAVAIGMIAAAIGDYVSWVATLPTGATMVVVASLLLLAGLVKILRRSSVQALYLPAVPATAYALIAEPDPSQARVYAQIVESQGLACRVVRDGAAAVDILRTHGAPALTMMELSLPRLDGFRLIEEIRKLAPADRAAVVAISAFRNLRDSAVAQKNKLGIAALLARGAPVDSIFRTVRQVLARPQAKGRPAFGREMLPSSGPPRPDHKIADVRRLQRLSADHLVESGDKTQEEDLRALVDKVARRFSVPVALITFVLDDRQWFKAHVGLTGQLLEQRGSPRDWSFCTHVVEARAPLVVPDAAVHPSFAQNPLVKDGSVRSYAGVPLEMPSGEVLGSLCIIDTKPMAISAEDVDELAMVAKTVAAELELRSARKRQAPEKLLVEKTSSDGREKDTALAYLTAAMANIDDGVLLFEPKRRVVLVNRALAQLFGMQTSDFLRKHWDEILAQIAALMRDPDDFRRRLRVAPEGALALRGEFEMEKPQHRHVRWTVKPVEIEGGIFHLVVVNDVTAEIDLILDRERLARTDALTGLLNRGGAEETLEREASRSKRFNTQLSVALFDIDRFKEVNDTHGHAAGDEALRAVARAMVAAVRGMDVVTRWGGDELLAILPNTGLDGARHFAERVRNAVEKLEPELMHGATVSAGIADLAHGERWEDAVKRADDKLYEAKQAGRNRVV
jgi:diguanylate cyclase (GGDEF)-like protein